MKKIFVIDWCLIPVFVLSAFTGVGLHLAGHGNIQEVWHDWAVAHIVSSLLFLIGVCLHIKTHWGWYKGLFKNGLGRKSRVTLIVSGIFMLVLFSGIGLLLVNGANSPLGLWHYKIGLFAVVLFCLHIVKRMEVLRKSLC